MGRSSKQEKDTPSFDPYEMNQNIALAMDQIEPMMAIPQKVRQEWLNRGFSETVAEQAAIAVWLNLWTPQATQEK